MQDSDETPKPTHQGRTEDSFRPVRGRTEGESGATVDLPVADSLNSAARHVAGSQGAGEPGDGSGEAFAASFKALVDWADSNRLILEEKDFSIFSRPPDAFGDEHEAWYDESGSFWYKATYANRFGMGWGRSDSATVREYLSRLVLQNRFFGDDIELVAVINCAGKIRILTQQRHIQGDPAPYDEITTWFTNIGFCKIESGDRIAWYLPAENLLVADAHEGNVIKTREGHLVPIDLNLIQPCESMRIAVLNCVAAA